MLKNQVVESFSAVIGDRTVTARVQNKEKAKKKYEEAKAAGKQAIYAQRDTVKKEEWLKLKLGNLKPDQDAVITLKLIEPATELVGGAYSFRVPNKYFPRYKIVNKKALPYPDYDPNNYTFRYEIELAAPKHKTINYVSTPSGVKISENKMNRVLKIATDVTDSPPRKDIRIFYKTTDMMLTPNLFVEKSFRYPLKVAVAATFAPTFEKKSNKMRMYATDEVPEKLPVNGTEFHFVFIIDRSGSMSG